MIARCVSAVLAIVLLAGCGKAPTPSPEEAFATKLRVAGFSNPSVSRGTDADNTILVAEVTVKGCRLELNQTIGQKGYHLDKLHFANHKIDWPKPQPINPQLATLEQLVAAKPPVLQQLEKCRQ